MQQTLRRIGRAGVASGWRKKVADTAERPLERRTPFAGDQVRAALGLAFVAISGVYLAKTFRRAFG